jgi:NhaA family Na+:H+ antiporter
MTKLFKEFIESEKAGGIILIMGTIISLLLANSEISQNYVNFWHFDLGGHSLVHWINDGLMTIFFLLIGLELEREVYTGQLSSLKSASLPFFAALGGMILPAGIFLLLNYGTNTQSGAGIPMATDIAFAVGILTLLGNRVPTSLKIFLVALAIIDDLGAILIIAIFYTKTLLLTNLFISLGAFGFLIILNRLKIHNLIPYLIGGIVMWYFMLNSGVHATITGVLLAFVIPFGNGGKKTASYILQHYLHKPVAFLILPVFAMANTAITIGENWQSGLTDSSGLGIIIGLVLGKPLGIFLFSFISVSLGICTLPKGLKWKNIVGVGLLAGIGFTMSIFITILAFEDQITIDNSKIVIMIASVIAGLLGFLYLKYTLPAKIKKEQKPVKN